MPRRVRVSRVRQMFYGKDRAMTLRSPFLRAGCWACCILMMGALRASKQCLQCHDVQRGELLGTFSYEMLRDPPLEAK